jgi:putative acetyltransferase
MAMPTPRIATTGDIPAMWVLRTRAVRQTCASHYPPDIIDRWACAAPPVSYSPLVTAGGAVIVEENGAMLGFAVLDVEGGEVNAVFVEPAAGRRGIGRILIRALEDMAVAAGCGRLHLSASLNAVPFYAAFGFERAGEESQPHRSGILLDAVLMEKRLLVTPAASNARAPTN